jgi:hypothetical protein
MKRGLLEKMHIPSSGAIFHFLAMEVVSMLLWWGVSTMFSNQLIRDIGFLVVFVAGIFAVAWYLPKLPAFKGNKAITLKNLGWLEGLIREQRSQPQKYLYPKLRKLSVSNSSELGVEVDWFNCNVFGLVFTALSGEMAIDDTSIGHQITLRSKYHCSPCEHCICTFDIMVDSNVISLIRDAAKKANRVKCNVVLNWEVSPAEEAKSLLKPFTKQYSEQSIVIVPS